MKTALNLDDELLREAERAAARSGRSVSALVEDLLRAELARQEGATAGRPANGNPANGDQTQPANGKDSPPGELPGNDSDDSGEVLPSFHMGPPLPDVNLDSNRELRDYLDEIDPEGNFRCF